MFKSNAQEQRHLMDCECNYLKMMKARIIKSAIAWLELGQHTIQAKKFLLLHKAIRFCEEAVFDSRDLY